MKNTLVIVTLALLLSACAGHAPVLTTSSSTPITTVAAANTAPTQGKSPTAAGRAETDNAKLDSSLPLLELTDELLLKILSSELEFQRGEWQSAYVKLLAAAQQTRDPRLARRAVEIALTVKQADKILTAARLWHALAPGSEEATQYYLGLIMMSDNLTEAQPLMEQRIKEASPQARPLLMFQAQRLLARAPDKTAGFALLERIVAPYLTMPEAHLVLAEGAVAKGDPIRAQAEARAALAAKPDSELAAQTLAYVTQDKTEAAKGLVRFLESNPKALNVRVIYGRLLIEQKQYDQAQKQFELVLQDRPQDLTSLYALGILGTQNKNLPEAEKYLTTYLSLLATRPNEKRDTSQALLILAQIAEERHDTDAALKWLSQIGPGESYLGAQFRQAQLIAKRGDVAAARTLLDGIEVEAEREQVQVIITESQILRDANQMTEAFAAFEAGRLRFPENTDLLYDYAMLAEKENRLELMETMLRKIILLAPTSQHAYNALGYALAERNIRLPEAYTLIEKAMQLAPDDPFIMDSMGWVQFRLGKLQEAESLLRRAYALRPDAEIAVHLGEVLWVKGLKEDAQKLWRDAQTKDPKNGTLKSTLVRLQVSL